MKSHVFSLCLLISLLCACSQSVQPPIVTPAYSIDFGSSPLWRELDTTIWVKLTSSSAITSISVVDSNFTLLDTFRSKDSLKISLRYQPISMADHRGSCIILSNRDTLATLTLLGVTSAFERRVGDSYTYTCQTNTGSFSNTITIVDLKPGAQCLQSAGRGNIDSYFKQSFFDDSSNLRSAFLKTSLSDLLLRGNIRIGSGSDWDTSGGYGDGFKVDEEWWSMKCIKGSDSIVAFNSSTLNVATLTNYNSYWKWHGPRTGYTLATEDVLMAQYCKEIGFFTSITFRRSNFEYMGMYNTDGSKDDSPELETYRLLSFHLKR